MAPTVAARYPFDSKTPRAADNSCSAVAAAGAPADAAAAVRRGAARLAAAVPEADVVGALGDDEPYVAEMAAWALGEQGRRDAAAIDALAGMAVEHADPLCREAAVAAL